MNNIISNIPRYFQFWLISLAFIYAYKEFYLNSKSANTIILNRKLKISLFICFLSMIFAFGLNLGGYIDNLSQIDEGNYTIWSYFVLVIKSLSGDAESIYIFGEKTISYIPLGFCLASLFKKERHNRMLPTFICVIIILSITCIQFLIGKVFDICSMILNIGGAWLGIFIFRALYICGSNSWFDYDIKNGPLKELLYLILFSIPTILLFSYIKCLR